MTNQRMTRIILYPSATLFPERFKRGRLQSRRRPVSPPLSRYSGCDGRCYQRARLEEAPVSNRRNFRPSHPPIPSVPVGWCSLKVWRTEREYGRFPPCQYTETSVVVLRWLAYIYFRYTGQVSFRPLKSARGASKIPPNGSGAPPSCSPKSMYRLAASVSEVLERHIHELIHIAWQLGDERMKELALRAIKEGLSKDNIVEEAFSWFTAQ